MEPCDKYRRPRAAPCPRPSLAGNQRSRPNPWGPNNSYFRACFDKDPDLGGEDSEIENSIVRAKGPDYSMSTSRAADNKEEDEDEDGDGDDGDEDASADTLGNCSSYIGTETASNRKLRSSVDDNVNRFNDESSSGRGGRFDESAIEQDYLDDFESTTSESASNISFASSTQGRKGGAQGVDDGSKEETKKEIDFFLSEDVASELGEEPGRLMSMSMNETRTSHQWKRMSVQNGRMSMADRRMSMPERGLILPLPTYEQPEEYTEEKMEDDTIGKISTKMGIKKCQLKDQRVLMRVDLNVPVEDGQIMNMEKIESALPTIQYALDRGAKSVVLMSHMGRPEGRVVPELSLRPVADALESLLGGRTVTFLEDCVGDAVKDACADPEPGSVILLENLRFHPEEEGKGVDKEGEKVKATPKDVHAFREALSELGDIYINDAFGTAHREHSSVVGIDLPVKAAGFLLKKEVEAVSKVKEEPEKPYLAIVGGENVSDKIHLIDNLLNSVTDIIIAGGVAFTFLKLLQDMEIGETPFNSEVAELVPQVYQKALDKNVTLHFPVDFVVADPSGEDASKETVDVETGIPAGKVGVDIGEQTQEMFADIVSEANTIIWNGPPGACESDNFSGGSKAITDAVTEAIEREIPVILGDRETTTCAKKFDLNMESVMTGGASLELLEGKVLPGIAALSPLPKRKPDTYVRPMRKCPLANLRVGVRLDLDIHVSRDDNGEFTLTEHGFLKMEAVLPTIEKALLMGAKSVVIFSHRGNPKGHADPELSMEPIAHVLEELLEKEVIFCSDAASLAKCENPEPGSVFLMENLRFHQEEEVHMMFPPRISKSWLSNLTSAATLQSEADLGAVDAPAEGDVDGRRATVDENIKEEEKEKKDVMETKSSALVAGTISAMSNPSIRRIFADQVDGFRAALSHLVDVFIMDDFSLIHLPHSSVVGVKGRFMACGPLVEQELDFVATSLHVPDRPLVVVLGGDKVQEKMDLIPGLLDVVDDIVIGGALAFPFLASLNEMPIGNFSATQAMIDQVPDLMAAAEAKNVNIHLPEDFLVAESPSSPGDVVTVDVEEGIPEGKIGLDIGERSRAKFGEVVANAKTIVWSGPLGVVETHAFQGGTDAVLTAVSRATDGGALSVLTGGAIVDYAEIKRQDLDGPNISRMAAPAIMGLLAGQKLPGLGVLEPGFKPKQGHKRRRKKKKKKKKKRHSHDEKPLIDRLTRIASWLHNIANDKGWKYKPPYTRDLPPLLQLRKHGPPIKYTGAPPPGKNKPLGTSTKLFRLNQWKPLPPPPPKPKKPHVPRLASMKRREPTIPPLRSVAEAPWSHKHKIGLSGMPGFTYYRPHPMPLPCIMSEKEKVPRVPTQIPVIARFDKDGNLLVHVDGTQKEVPEDAKIQVTLVRGYNACLGKKPVAPRIKLQQEYRLPPKLVPWPHDYDPNAFHPDLPFPGRYPRFNTTLTQENYIRYRRIFDG